MDNWRGQFPDHGEAPADSREFDEDEGGDDLPPIVVGQDERRMQVRAYNFWAAMLDDRNFPSADQLDLNNLSDFGPNCVLMYFTDDVHNPKISFLGEKLATECGTQGSIAYLSDVPGRSLLSRITDHHLQIIANQAPIGFEAEFVNQRGNTILYRGILLPFSQDNQTIDSILGVINWKHLADEETTAELMQEIDKALNPIKSASPVKKRDKVPMTSWADGPVHFPGSRASSHEFPSTYDDLPMPSFVANPMEVDLPDSAQAVSYNDSPLTEMELADLLASARSSANEAKSYQSRTHQALYQAIGDAYDFSLAAERDPDTLRELLEYSEITASQRNGMSSIVKLIFGADYDKTRMAEFATALSHAHRHKLGLGELSGYIGRAVGGLKAIVAEERRLRRDEKGSLAKRPAKTAPSDAIALELRKLEAFNLDAISGEGSEFTLLIARRNTNGEVTLLGEVSQDIPLIERAAKHLLS